MENNLIAKLHPETENALRKDMQQRIIEAGNKNYELAKEILNMENKTTTTQVNAVDEAAEKYCFGMLNYEWVDKEKDHTFEEQYNAFKAGAEWQYKQTTPPTDIVDEDELDKLAKEYAEKIHQNPAMNMFRHYCANDFKAGFKAKAALQSTKGFTLEQGREIWKAGQEYWKTSGASITFEELSEKIIPSLLKEIGKKVE